jgi:hypothetical protein
MSTPSFTSVVIAVNPILLLVVVVVFFFLSIFLNFLIFLFYFFFPSGDEHHRVPTTITKQSAAGSPVVCPPVTVSARVTLCPNVGRVAVAALRLTPTSHTTRKRAAGQ